MQQPDVACLLCPAPISDRDAGDEAEAMEGVSI